MLFRRAKVADHVAALEQRRATLHASAAAAAEAEETFEIARASDARARARRARRHQDASVIAGRNFEWGHAFASTHRAEYGEPGAAMRGGAAARLPVGVTTTVAQYADRL